MTSDINLDSQKLDLQLLYRIFLDYINFFIGSHGGGRTCECQALAKILQLLSASRWTFIIAIASSQRHDRLREPNM